MVKLNARKQLGMILANKTEILDKIIQDGLSDDTAPRDRLAIYKALNELDERLNNAIENERKAVDFLNELKRRPKLELQESTFSASQTTTSSNKF